MKEFKNPHDQREIKAEIIKVIRLNKPSKLVHLARVLEDCKSKVGLKKDWSFIAEILEKDGKYSDAEMLYGLAIKKATDRRWAASFYKDEHRRLTKKNWKIEKQRWRNFDKKREEKYQLDFDKEGNPRVYGLYEALREEGIPHAVMDRAIRDGRYQISAKAVLVTVGRYLIFDNNVRRAAIKAGIPIKAIDQLQKLVAKDPKANFGNFMMAYYLARAEAHPKQAAVYRHPASNYAPWEQKNYKEAYLRQRLIQIAAHNPKIKFKSIATRGDWIFADMEIRHLKIKIKYPMQFETGAKPVKLKYILDRLSKIPPQMLAKLEIIIFAPKPKKNTLASATRGGNTVWIYPNNNGFVWSKKGVALFVLYHELGHLYFNGGMGKAYQKAITEHNEDYFLTEYSRRGGGVKISYRNVNGKKFSLFEDFADFFGCYFFLRSGGDIRSLRYHRPEAYRILRSTDISNKLLALKLMFPARFDYMVSVEKRLFGTQPNLPPNPSMIRIDLSPANSLKRSWRMNYQARRDLLNYYRALHRINPNSFMNGVLKEAREKAVKASLRDANKYLGDEIDEGNHDYVLASLRFALTIDPHNEELNRILEEHTDECHHWLRKGRDTKRVKFVGGKKQ